MPIDDNSLLILYKNECERYSKKSKRIKQNFPFKSKMLTMKVSLT